MIASMATAPAGVYASATDRALGDTGIALRASIVRALADRDSDDRSAEIYRRVSAALQTASKEQSFTSPEAAGRTLEILKVLPR